MYNEFDKFKKWLSVNFKDGLNSLNPPATDKEIKDIERTLEITLPQDLASLLKINNGQSRHTSFLFKGQEFMSSHRIIEEWLIWKNLSDKGSFDDSESQSENGIKSKWWNNKWIPFSYDGGGNHYCLDCDPDDCGTHGQVIEMWHDEGDRNLLSPSLTEWISQYVSELESGDYVYCEDEEGIIHKDDL